MAAFRLPPKMAPQNYLTWRTRAPFSTHWRRATCAEFECEAHLCGWASIVPADGEQAQYIRHRSGRRFTEQAQPGGLVRFEFEAGQTCFAAADHRVPLGRPPLYLVRHGDWRRSVPLRSHTSADSFMDDMTTHLDRIRREAE